MARQSNVTRPRLQEKLWRKFLAALRVLDECEVWEDVLVEDLDKPSYAATKEKILVALEMTQ